MVFNCISVINDYSKISVKILLENLYRELRYSLVLITLDLFQNYVFKQQISTIENVIYLFLKHNLFQGILWEWKQQK